MTISCSSPRHSIPVFPSARASRLGYPNLLHSIQFREHKKVASNRSINGKAPRRSIGVCDKMRPKRTQPKRPTIGSVALLRQRVCPQRQRKNQSDKQGNEKDLQPWFFSYYYNVQESQHTNNKDCKRRLCLLYHSRCVFCAALPVLLAPPPSIDRGRKHHARSNRITSRRYTLFNTVYTTYTWAACANRAFWLLPTKLARAKTTKIRINSLWLYTYIFMNIINRNNSLFSSIKIRVPR